MEKEIDINNEEQILKEFNFDYCYNSEKCSRELSAFYNDLIGLSDSKKFMYNQAKIDLGRIAITLNKQSERIKELEKENQKANIKNYLTDYYLVEKENQQLKEDYTITKQSKEHFKKVAENVVDLLSILNKELPSPQLEELNYKKCIDDAIYLIKENKQLKQSQNQKAIEVLEQLRRDIWTDQQDDGWLDEKVDLYYLSETIDNKIKELSENKK